MNCSVSLRAILLMCIVIITVGCSSSTNSNLETIAVITGSDIVISDSLNTFSAEDSRTFHEITDWMWSIEGDASIEEDNGETVKIRADDIPGTSSSFTLSLEVYDEFYGWSDVASKEIVINRYEFKVTCESHANTGYFNGMPATGKTATWEMTDTIVGYWRYRIEFTGNITDLPDNIDVTITWSRDNCAYFLWGDSTNSSDTMTVSVPRTGGTIGNLGTVLDPGGNARPTVQGASSGQTAGTVTFENEYIETLILTIDGP